MNDLTVLIKKRLNGALSVSRICGVSPRAVYKWIDSGRLPRTEYTGETFYARKLADAHVGVSEEEILRAGGYTH